MLDGIRSELSTEIIFVTFINNGGVSRSPHLSCEGHLVGGLVEFSLAVVPSVATGEVHGLEREFPDVDIAEITGWSIRSRARSAKSSVDQL